MGAIPYHKVVNCILASAYYKFELDKMIIKGKGGTKDFRRGMELIMESRDRGYIKAIAWCEKLERHHDF